MSPAAVKWLPCSFLFLYPVLLFLRAGWLVMAASTADRLGMLQGSDSTLTNFYPLPAALESGSNIPNAPGRAPSRR